MGILLLLPVILAVAAAFGLAALTRSRSAISGDHVIITKVFRRLLGWRLGGFALGLASAVAVPFIALGVFDCQWTAGTDRRRTPKLTMGGQ